MADSLQANIHEWERAEEMVRQARDKLELRVEERTVELREANEALRRSEERYRLVTDALPALIAYVDADRRYRFNNETYETWFGLRPEELSGRHIKEVIGEEEYKTIRRHIDRVLSGKEAKYDGAFQNTKVGPRSFQAHYLPDFGDDGEIKGFFALVTDITERKRAEEALRVSEARLMEAQRIARLGSWAWYVQTGKVDASDEVYRIFGLKRQQCGLRFEALAHRIYASDRDLRRNTIDAALRYGDFYKIDYRINHPDQGLRIIREQGNVTLDPAGRPAHVVGTVQDITDLKKSERELMERNRELQTLFRISEITVGSQTLEAALQQIVEVIRLDTGFPIVTIERYDEARQKMLIHGTKGFSLSRGAGPVEMPVEETLSGIVVRTGRPLIETRGLERPAYARRTRHLPDVQTFIGVPVATDNQIIGALCFAHGEVIAVDESRLKWMASLGHSVAALMERKWAEEILRQPDGDAEALTERFLKEGMGSLSDQEMIELVLLPVLGRFNVIPVTKRLFARFGCFAEIISADPQALAEVKGVGKHTITALKAVQGAAVRLARQDILGRPVVSTWNKLLDYCRASMAYAKKEEFRVLFLDRRNVLIADEVLHTGTVDHTPVYPREVMKRALDLGASAIILVHNHPSGDPTPSRDDIEITREVREAGEKLGIAVHDHLIIGRRGHASFKSLDLL